MKLRRLVKLGISVLLFASLGLSMAAQNQDKDKDESKHGGKGKAKDSCKETWDNYCKGHPERMCGSDTEKCIISVSDTSPAANPTTTVSRDIVCVVHGTNIEWIDAKAAGGTFNIDFGEHSPFANTSTFDGDSDDSDSGEISDGAIGCHKYKASHGTNGVSATPLDPKVIVQGMGARPPRS